MVRLFIDERRFDLFDDVVENVCVFFGQTSSSSFVAVSKPCTQRQFARAAERTATQIVVAQPS